MGMGCKPDLDGYESDMLRGAQLKPVSSPARPSNHSQSEPASPGDADNRESGKPKRFMVERLVLPRSKSVEKSTGDMVAEAVAHYEQTKLVMLEIEARVIEAKSKWLSDGIATDVATRVADESRLMAARVENQKAKMKLAELKSIAKKIKNENMLSLLIKHLKDSGHQHIVDDAHEHSLKIIEESGFMKAYDS